MESVGRKLFEAKIESVSERKVVELTDEDGRTSQNDATWTH